MRAAVVALALALAGCVVEEGPAAATLPHARIESLAVAPACVPRGAPVTLTLVVSNPTAENGTARVAVYAQQYGNLVETTVPLAARETRTLSIPATLDVPGRWSLYATGADVSATEVTLVVTDPTSAQGPRC